MVSSLIFAHFRTVTPAMVAKVLHQRYTPLLNVLSCVQSAAVCQEFSATLSELIGASLEVRWEWGPKGEEETDELYAFRIQREVEGVRNSERNLLIIAPESVICGIAKSAGRMTDDLAVAVVTNEREFVFLSKFEAYPILCPLKSTAERITAVFREAKVETSSAVVLDPKRVAVKQFQSLQSTMDTYKERMVSAIDRTQKQSEKHLDGVENELYKKMQLKLQKIDDFIQAQKSVTKGLEDVKEKFDSPAEVVGLRKRLDALNNTLARCQKDLQELENSAGSYADDSFKKMLPLHIMKNAQLVGDIVYIRVVNLKSGVIRGALLQISSEQGEEELSVLDLKPGIQKIGIKLKKDLYSLVFLRIVFSLLDANISNQLEMKFTDESPPSLPILAINPPSFLQAPPESKPEESKSSEISAQCVVQDPSCVPADKVEFDLNERELGLLRQMEELFQEESKSEAFRSRFLAIVRGPRGSNIDVQDLGDRMLG